MPQTHSAGTPATTPDVIVIGEALVDVVTSPEGTVEHPGGSPANVAYGLGRLGVRAALLTSIGDDDRGAAIQAHLTRAGVALLPGSTSQGRTASATAILADDGSATYDFDIRWELPQVAPAFLPKVLHTGSIATFLAPGAAAVRTLLEQSHRECVVTYDPNIRPALLGSQAEARTIFEDLVPLTDVVKLSDEDARWLYPRLQPGTPRSGFSGWAPDWPSSPAAPRGPCWQPRPHSCTSLPPRRWSLTPSAPATPTWPP